MKTYSRRWLYLSLALAWLPGGVLADESWDGIMQSRCLGSYAIEAPIDPVVAQGVGRCFLQLSQSPEFDLTSQRHLALEYADSWFSYAASQGMPDSTEDWAITQNQLNQLMPVQKQIKK